MIDIRLANEIDAPVIVEFQIKMAEETENFILDRDTVVNGVISVFRDSQKGKYYVATEDNIVVASMLITHEWSDWRNSWIFWIQSVFVIPKKRGLGVFKQMYKYIFEFVNKSDEVAGVRLYVDLNNESARSVYSKIGMNGDHYQVFEWMK